MSKSIRSRIITKGSRLRKWAIIFFLVTTVSSAIIANSEADILTPDERNWLQKHREALIVGHQVGAPPLSFIQNNTVSGFNKDFLQLLEEKLEFRFNRAQPDTFNILLKQLKNNEIAILPNTSKTKGREKEYDFSLSYITIPTVFVARATRAENINLANRDKRTVAVVRDWATHLFLQREFEHLTISPQELPIDCVLQVTTSFADLAFVNQATASYLIKTQGIRGLTIENYSRFSNDIHFAVRKDLPELTAILNKGIIAIEQEDMDRLYAKWINMEEGPYYTRPEFIKIVLGSFIGILFLIGIIISWNIRLKSEIRKRSSVLHEQQNALKQEINIRKQKEQDLEERKAYLATILKTIPDMVWSKNPEGKYQFYNKGFAKYHGITENLILDHTDFDYLDGDVARGLAEIDELVLKNGTPVTEEKTVIYAMDSKQAVLETITVPVITTKNKCLGVMGISRDISEIKSIEKELTRFKEQIETTLSNTDGFTFRVHNDEQLTVSFVSNHVEKFSGQSAFKFINRPLANWTNSIHREDRKQNQQTLQLALQNGSPTESEFRILHTNGEMFWVRATIFPVYDHGSDKVAYVDGIATNITKQRALERHLAQAKQLEAAGVVAGGIAHDFNNLLTGIIGFGQLLQEDLEEADYAEESLLAINNILSGGNRAKELVAQILLFSRMDEKQESTVAIRDIGMEVANFLRATINKDIHIETEFTSDRLIKASPTRLRQLMISLCTENVRSIGGTSGILFLSLHELYIENETSPTMDIRPGLYLQLTIENRSKTETGNFFSNLYPPPSTSAWPQEESMVMWAANEITKDTGGAFTLSGNPEKGYCLKLLFPLHEKVEPVVVTGKNILFVDKERTLTSFMKDIMEAGGQEVTACNSGAEAIIKLYSPDIHFDLLITELDLNDISGAELAAMARKADPLIKIIVTSSTPCDTLYKDSTFDSVLEKPYSISKLEGIIGRVFT